MNTSGPIRSSMRAWRARQTHAAHYVQLEHVHPVLVGDIGKLLHLEEPDVVDEDVNRPDPVRSFEDFSCAFHGCEIRRDAVCLTAARERLDGIVDRRLFAPFTITLRPRE